MHFGLSPRNSITWSKTASLLPSQGSASLPSANLCLGEKKKSLSKAYNLDLRSTADCDYIYNSLFTEKWGVIFGLISAFWTQSPFLSQRCKAVKNQSSYPILIQNWQPSWIAASHWKGFDRITWNVFHCTPKNWAASHVYLHLLFCKQDSKLSAFLFCPLPIFVCSLVKLQDNSAELELILSKSLLHCQKRPQKGEISGQMLVLDVHDSSVNWAQDWIINWELWLAALLGL